MAYPAFNAKSSSSRQPAFARRAAGLLLVSGLMAGCAAPTGLPASELSTGSLRESDMAFASASDAVRKIRSARRSKGVKAALNLAEAAVKAMPSETIVRRERGLVALEAGLSKRAISDLEMVATADSTDWRSLSALGSAHAANGDHRAAVSAFERALKLSPGSSSVLNNMAMSYALDGQGRKAKALLKKAETHAKTERAKRRVRQNRVLIAGLSGQVGQARTLAAKSMSKSEVTANIALLEKLRSAAKVSRAKSTPASPRSKRRASNNR